MSTIESRNFRRGPADAALDASVAARASFVDDGSMTERRPSLGAGTVAYLVDGFAAGACAFYGTPWHHPTARPERPHASVGGARRPAARSLLWRGATLVARGVACLCRTLKREAEVARARRALESMDDRMLRDIGITHGQIYGVTRRGRDDFR